jgi:KDO2-lipid IV(A) lauroyltransferase
VSDIFYVVIYYGFGYRKKVVRQNLERSFPEKSADELVLLEKKFYRFFCDLFLETFKSLTISKKQMLKHCSFDENSLVLLNNLASEKKSVLLLLGHQGNWEWAGNTFSIIGLHQLYVVYHPLTNIHFNKLMYKMRTRFGTKLIAMKDTYKEMFQHSKEVNATAFIADQTPNPKNACWVNFLNQDTPFFLGAEKIATKMNRIALFVTVEKIKRGNYKLVIKKEDTLDPKNYQKEGDFTKAFTQKLETSILKDPSTWLWTHRRWKHNRNTIN